MRAENETFVQELMAKHVGASFERDQRHVLEARLTSLARGKRLENADALVGTLRGAPNGPLLDSVIEALTTHETTFFRDGTPFKALSFHVLPELIRARGRQRRLSIWSAACSTGQEPYSLAMLLRERFPELERWDLRLLGTDVCKATLERAREGRYGHLEVKRGLTQGARDKFFVREGEDYRIREPIRRMVTWETINLTAEWPSMSVCDLILMRNVLIYFNPEARRRVFRNVARHLAPDGYLLLGTSETTFGSSDELTPCTVDGATFYRRAAK